MASLNDLVTDTRNAARPNSAKVSSSRSPSGPTLVCDNLSGWPTASKVHFVTYQIDSSSNPVAGTQLDAVGIVSGNSITSFTVKDGTDGGNAVNDVVEMLPTAAWGQDLATALVTEHDRTGKHTNITTTSITNSGNSTIGGNQTVAGTLGVTGATTFTGAVGGAGYDAKTLANSYKFSVYNSASTTIAASFVYTKVGFQTKEYDTGANFDAATNFRFTAPVAGFYRLSASVVQFVQNTTIGDCALYKNGAIVKTGSTWNNNTGGNQNMASNVVCELQLSANDFIEVFARQSVGSTASTANTSYQTYFNGSLVSAT